MGMCDCDLEAIPMKTSYSKFEYQQAKAFIKGAEIVQRFSTPSFTNTIYIIGGIRWQESESHLESPEDDYSLEVVKS
jgi:hypothetical protein